MNTIHWLESKQLDRVTNYSTETECIRNILAAGGKMYYYCTFAKQKVYYGLEDNIIYLGTFRNRFIKHFEFPIRIRLKAIQIVMKNRNDVIMVNQDLVKLLRPAIWLNKLLKRNNRFVLDIRTLPTDMKNFDQSMRQYYKQIGFAVKHFDGLSFITPFMEKVSLEPFKNQLPTVTWSSGVDVDLFDANKYDYTRDSDTFRIFYHGGIWESRGNIDLIKACAKVVERGYNIELVQIGKIVDKSIRKYIEDNKYNSWCHLYDAKPLEEIPAMVAKCDLPLLPFPDFLAWRVSSPIKLMEYMAMGKPVLVPDMECFTDILLPESGMVYYYNLHANNLIEEMADAIIQRVENKTGDKTYVKENACIKYVKENFTWKKQAENLMNFCLKSFNSIYGS